MKKQKQQKSPLGIRFIRKTPLMVLMTIMGASFLVAPFAQADRFDQQIQQIEQNNSSIRQKRDGLSVEASSLNDAISKLQLQINNLQAQIDANQAKSNELQRQIKIAQAELEKQKKLLGENIRVMYLEGQISTLEMLASSKDLSDFLDKQEYRNAVQAKIKDTLDRVTALKAKLKSQNETLQKMIADQKSMQNQLAGQKAEQNRLLSLNQQQQATLNKQIVDNNAKIIELRRQQLIENTRAILSGMRSGIPGGGGYPGYWAFAPQDSLIDNWGMFNRECVSYAAWHVAASGKYMPYWGGVGNANQWPGNARNSGIPMDYGTNAHVGDVAISTAGYYGHAMIVEAVNGDGTVTVSQYNQFLDGTYSVNTRYMSNLYFIHF